MKFKYYKIGGIILLSFAIVFLMLYLDKRFPERIDVDKYDLNAAASIGLTRGQIYCSKKATLELVYNENLSKQISLKTICDSFWN